LPVDEEPSRGNLDASAIAARESIGRNGGAAEDGDFVAAN
jgi:hypothetical protein